MITDEQKQAIDELYSLVQTRRKEGKICYFNGDGIVSIPLESFTKQGVSGMLYDLNRLDEVLLTLAKSGDQVDLVDFLPNELAMVTLIDYLMNENNKLKSQLNPNQSYNGTHMD